MVQTLSMGAVSMYLFALQVIANAPQPYPPLDFMTGDDSYTERASVELATDPQSWNGVWQRYKGVTPIGNAQTFPSLERPPNVDFDHNFVLVIYGGLASVQGYRVADSFTEKKKLYVHMQEVPIGNVPSGFKANPYAFIVFPRTKFPIEVDFPSRDQVWRSVAQLGPTDVSGK